MIELLGVQLLALLPLLVVLGVGVVLLLVRRDRVPPVSRGTGVAGCVLLAVTALGQALFSASLLNLQRDAHLGVTQIATLASVVGLAAAVLHAAGIGLLVAAVLSGRRPAVSGVVPGVVPGVAFGGQPTGYYGRPPGGPGGPQAR